MIVNLRRWLSDIWPDHGAARQLLHEYAILGSCKLLLADIALRGGAWTSSHVPGDPHSSAYNEGRRAMALEILKLAGQPVDQLLAQLPPLKPRSDS